MSMRLVPYAGTERPPLRPMRAAAKRAALLAWIIERQKHGRLLSEIGKEFSDPISVRAVLLAWLFEAAA
jgi:hypothetical protein